MTRYDLIAFDADDTLWHNERLYEQTQARLAELLAHYGVDSRTLAERLYAKETGNIGLFGYGIKSFALSMIEAAVELTDGHISGRDVLAILSFAKAQLTAPVELLENVKETISLLASLHRLMIVTKGDLLDQQAKLDRSGLNVFFQTIEVVSNKTVESYARLFKTHGLDPARVLMVGDSVRSDILPILELGGTAVHIPYLVTWQHEAAEVPASGTSNFYQLSRIEELPALLDKLETV
jgi:putative hydrolase of the HAD superfamily